MRASLVALAAACAAAEEAACADGGSSYPRVVIGCWQLLERFRNEEKAVQTLQAYAEAGFTTFDTADIYGESEGILGKLRERAAGAYEPTIHTKYVTDDAALANARRVNAQSRRALGGVPALVAFHWWDYSDGRFVDAAGHLVTLQGEGLLRDVAACNFDTPHLRALVDAGVPVVSNQVQYSLLDRRPENGMLQYAREKGIRLACFGTVAGGWLSDRHLGKHKPAERGTVSARMYRAALDRWSGGDWELFQELLWALRKVGNRHGGASIANVAAAWVLYQLGPAGGWVILGVRDTAHLDEHSQLVAGGGLALDDDDAASIGAVLAKGHPPKGDIWSHERGYA